MKKQMKQVAAATLAALCFGAVAIPTVASAATINVTESVTNIDLSKTTLTAYKVFGIIVTTDDKGTADVGDDVTITQIDGATVSLAVANVFKGKGVALTAEEIAATTAADKTTAENAALLKSLAQKIGDYLGDLENDSDATRALARALADVVTGGQEFLAAVDNGTATLTGVDAGYYLVTGTTVDGNEEVYSSVMLKSGDDVINITLKADKPTVDKNIVEGNDLVDANTAGVGQTVDYQVDSKVPDHTYYAKYYMAFTDTIGDGLDFVENVVVKVGGEDKTADAVITYSGNTMTIVFEDVTDYAIGAPIVITYSATVDEDAIVDPENGNPNAIKLTYSNDPNWDTDGDGIPDDKDANPDTPNPSEPNPDNPNEPFTPEDFTPPVEETPPVEVITYLTKLVLNKVDEAGNKMEGVRFKLTGATHGTTYYVENTAGEWVVTSESGNPVDVSTDEDGQIVFSGLTADTYTISEIEAPQGFIKADDYVVNIVATFEDQDGSTEAPAWKYNDSDSNEVTIINRKGTTLPETGGIGTTIFTIVGLTLMATATGAFIIKRKVTAQ